MSDIIERLEKATGPDRELDEAIADALFTEKQRTCIKGLSDAEGGMWMWRYPDGSIGNALRFTASLDAAMTLIPEGWDYGCGNHDATTRAWAWVAEQEDARGEYWQTIQTHNAATPALALCAAALKARASMDGSVVLTGDGRLVRCE